MAAAQRPITLSIAALGGQGGGVVTDWLVLAARRAGYIVQATSVPGVAQRTGATIYYLEFFAQSALGADGREPILALMPSPGDVDIVVASEWVEVGRAINRGLVTPDRTTLIASTHRDYTISEKMALGDGRANSQNILAGATAAAARLIAFDMAAIAEKSGGRISAVIFGAIAGAGVLPWTLEHFHEAIRESGIGVEPSLAAFEVGRQAALAAIGGGLATVIPAAGEAQSPAAPFSTALAAALRQRIAAQFPAELQGVLSRAAARLSDYQDAAYASLFLERVAQILALETPGRGSAQLTAVTARSLALWMSFEDVIRVAQVKTRAGRPEQIRQEVRANPGELVRVSEFVKPRVEEICATLPAGLGRFMLGSTRAKRILSRFTAGRQIPTSRIGGFALLRCIAGLRRFRRATLRFQTEQERIELWLQQIRSVAAADYALAVEIAECQNLVKGYGDTHERGWRSFSEICALAAGLAGTSKGAQQLRALREAALADDTGARLGQAIAGLKLSASV